MIKKNRREVFLADWITGALPDDTLKSLVSQEDYDSFIVIRNSLSVMQSPIPDFDVSYQQIQNKITEKRMKAPKKAMRPLRVISIAASLLILVTIGSYHLGLVGEKLYLSETALEKVSIGNAVQITLNQNTVLKQKASFYNTKSVYLDKGEAFFEVVKGNPFSIETRYGTVTVLGTKFTVKVSNDLFEVKCYEGKVKIEYEGAVFYVEKGTLFNTTLQSVIRMDVNHPLKPEWLMEYKKFDQSDIALVFSFIEKNYGVRIDYDSTIAKNKFTGSLPKDNLEDALNVICYSFNLRFELDDKNVIIKK